MAQRKKFAEAFGARLGGESLRPRVQIPPGPPYLFLKLVDSLLLFVVGF
jgi:hypothetical protein